MEWTSLFTRNILKRGRDYFYRGKVANLKIGEFSGQTQYSANVQGSRKYAVSVVVRGNKVTFMNCSCPYAADGSHCKHMASVLFAIEEREGQKHEAEERRKKEEAARLRRMKRKRITPFSCAEQPSASKHYQYFDFERITKDFVIYDLDYQDAAGLIAKGDAAFQIAFGYDSQSEYKGMIGKAAYGSALVCFSKDQILELRCGAYDCPCYYTGFKTIGGQKEPCIHILAALIQIQAHLNEHEVGDSTDFDALQLLQRLRKTRALQQAAAASTQRQINLRPRLIRNDERYGLAFRIGAQKLYVVRNLTELVTAVESREELSIGKQCELHFSQDSFDTQSERYFRLIQQGVNEIAHLNDREAQRSYGYSKRLEDGKADIDLYGSRWDDFFDTAQEDTLEYVDKTVSYAKAIPLHMREKAPDVLLTLKKDVEQNGTFHGVILEGALPEFIRSARRQYYLSIEAGCAYLNRIPPEVSKALEPLYLLQTSGEIALRVGRQNLSEFYYHALPILRKCATIIELDADVIDGYLPPKAAFVFYLDAVDRKPVCSVEAQYGSDTCSVFDCFRNDYQKESFRDGLREKEVIDIVQRYFPEPDVQNLTFHCGEDEDAVYHVLESGVRTLMEYGEVQCTNRFQSLRIRKTAKVQVGVSLKSGLLNLEISTKDISQEELLEVLKSYQLKKRYHRLKNGDFLNIDDNIAELSAMVEAMHLTPKEFIRGKMQIPAYRALYLDKMLEQCEGLYSNRDQHFRKLIKEFKTVNDSDFEAPESLQGILRNYQLYGHKWLRTLETYGFGGILADDMGLGKTLQIISVLAAAKEEKRVGCALIVCPSSLVYNWLEEFHRFAPQLSVGIVAGTKEERDEMIQNYRQWDVLVTSYDLLKRDIAHYEGVQFEYQILDEAQYIKTHTTAAAKSVKVIQSNHRFALTGTPIENRLSELWSIFDYLMPGFLYRYETFKKEIETPIAKKNDEAATMRLHRMVSPFILRRLKGDVLNDLPDKMEEVRYAHFSEQQQKIYDGQILRMKEMLERQDEDSVRRNKLQILAELTRIRQICCDPSLLFEDYQGESAKRVACKELIQSAIEGEHRILLFSQFTSMLDLLAQDLQQANIPYYMITGMTAKKERIELVKKFNSDETPVFLISLKAGGTGLNLTGADMVIHYDPWWNVAAQNQATDRAHRIGQTKVVTVYKLIAKDSIEEKIQQMQQSKKDLADAILSGELGNIGSLGKEELLELIQ